jgi:hypothetical protein
MTCSNILILSSSILPLLLSCSLLSQCVCGHACAHVCICVCEWLQLGSGLSRLLPQWSTKRWPFSSPLPEQRGQEGIWRALRWSTDSWREMAHSLLLTVTDLSSASQMGHQLQFCFTLTLRHMMVQSSLLKCNWTEFRLYQPTGLSDRPHLNLINSTYPIWLVLL